MDQILVPNIFPYRELSKENRRLSSSDMLGSTRLGGVYGDAKLASSSLVNYVNCRLHHDINSWSVGNRNHTCRMGLVVAILLVWAAIMAPLSAVAQQHYNDTWGYTCNGDVTTCTTYAFYRTYKEQESLVTVAGYFNMALAGIADGSGLSNLKPNAVLPQGQALYIPLDCSCTVTYVTSLTSQMPVQYVLQTGDTITLLATTMYGALTTYQAMMAWTPMKEVAELSPGDIIVVPIFCACPSSEQVASRTKYLLSYGVYPNETLDTISSNFGITTEELSAANQLAVDATLMTYTTLLVPVVSLPPIATMRFPHVNITQNNTASPTSDSSHTSSKVSIVAGVFAAGAVAVLVVAGLLTVRRRRRSASSKKQHKRSDFSDLLLRMFTFKELSKATKNFGRSERLGSGGFGAVYKGTLPCGELVAVKRIRMESKHGQESFRAEVTSLSHIRHRNLVQLRGWCHEEEQLFLVFDYMPNGSLDERLHRSSRGRDMKVFSLRMRHSILSDVAAALSYLHEECAQCVLHRDVKSSNVLLDGEWNAYLGDFGLARLVDHQKMGKTTMMGGTFGYMAPEMSHTGKATKESDVYSFGVLVLEVVCGAPPLDMTALEDGGLGVLVDKVWKIHEAGHILLAADSRLFPLPDSRLGSSSDVPEVDDVSRIPIEGQGAAMEDKQMITHLLHLGLLCCDPNPTDRPSMRVVSQLLLQASENVMEMSMPRLPRCKPQAHYEEPGFSQILGNAPLSGVGNGEHVIQASFVASSVIHSGR
jgi:serine/threonine protein kinase